MFFIVLFASILGSIVSYFLLDFYQKKIKPILIVNRSINSFYNSSNKRVDRNYDYERNDF